MIASFKCGGVGCESYREVKAAYQWLTRISESDDGESLYVGRSLV